MNKILMIGVIGLLVLSMGIVIATTYNEQPIEQIEEDIIITKDYIYLPDLQVGYKLSGVKEYGK